MIIKTAQFLCSSAKLSQCPTDGLPEFAFIGRSNVGKSSLINCITNNKKLSKNSSTPGKTRLINHFLINNKLYLVDLPGYGFAKIDKKTREALEKMISSYILKRKELKQLFILIDARHEPMAIDLTFIENIIDNNIPFAIVFTKSDKLSATARNKNMLLMQKNISEIAANVKYECFFTSAETRLGKDELVDYILDNAAKAFCNLSSPTPPISE